MDFQIAITILSLLLSSGVAAYITLRKLPTETKRAEVDIQAIFLEVNAKVQESYSGIIDELREHIDELDERLVKQRADFTIELSSRDTIIEDLKIRLGQTEERLRVEIDSNRLLTNRVVALEKEKECLEAENARLRGEAA